MNASNGMSSQQQQGPAPFLAPIEIFLHSGSSLTTSDTFDDCSFDLGHPIIAPDGFSMYISLISFTIPVSWHVISQYNNQLVINGTLYSLIPGNYSVSALVTALRSMLAQVLVTFSNITLKITLQSSVPMTISGSLCSVIGIAQGSSGTIISSTHTVDLTGQNSIYVLTNFGSGNVDTRSHDSIGSVLARVPVTSPPLGVEQFQDQNTGAGLLIADNAISSLRVRLEDELRRPLLSTLFWDATLQIKFVATGRRSLQIFRPTGFVAPDAFNLGE